jgi:ABC-type transporter Mla subunit MlaD
VALDLIANTLRLPYRQRLTLIINELGAGLAGNGSALNQAIHRADPALQQTDRVLAILAGENRTLADLARNSDTALAPLARERARAADFITKASVTGAATAARGGDLERVIQKLPGFLRTLTPTARQLGRTADQITPALSSLHEHTPAINAFVRGLGPFSSAALPAFRELGKTADVGSRALTVSQPVIEDLARFGKNVAPLSSSLASVASSFKSSGGVERALDTVFYLTSSENGYDSLSHYLRAALVVNLCSSYFSKPSPGCFSFFDKGTQTTAGSAGATAVPARARANRVPSLVARAVGRGRSPAGSESLLLDFLLGSGK